MDHHSRRHETCRAEWVVEGTAKSQTFVATHAESKQGAVIHQEESREAGTAQHHCPKLRNNLKQGAGFVHTAGGESPAL